MNYDQIKSNFKLDCNIFCTIKSFESSLSSRSKFLWPFVSPLTSFTRETANINQRTKERQSFASIALSLEGFQNILWPRTFSTSFFSSSLSLTIVASSYSAYIYSSEEVIATMNDGWWVDSSQTQRARHIFGIIRNFYSFIYCVSIAKCIWFSFNIQCKSAYDH